MAPLDRSDGCALRRPGPWRHARDRDAGQPLPGRAAALRDLPAVRSGARALEADPGLSAARLRLCRGAALPRVLRQRRPGPVRLEPVRRRPRPGARGRDRRAQGLVRQLAPGCRARSGDRRRRPAADDRGRHRLRRRHAQPRSRPRPLGRLGRSARPAVRRLHRPDRRPGGRRPLPDRSPAPLPGDRRCLARRHQRPRDRPRPPGELRPRAGLVAGAPRSGARRLAGRGLAACRPGRLLDLPDRFRRRPGRQRRPALVCGPGRRQQPPGPADGPRFKPKAAGTPSPPGPGASCPPSAGCWPRPARTEGRPGIARGLKRKPTRQPYGQRPSRPR